MVDETKNWEFCLTEKRKYKWVQIGEIENMHNNLNKGIPFFFFFKKF